MKRLLWIMLAIVLAVGPMLACSDADNAYTACQSDPGCHPAGGR